MDHPLRIGLLGAARIAPNALLRPAAANPAVAVVAVAARDPQRAQSFATQWGIPQVHPSYAGLLADPTIDAIYNPLPNGLHGEWTCKALQAGKHVLCEKPLAANATEAAAMAHVADNTGLILMEAFHTLYHPLAARLKAIVASGELGRIRHVEAHFCTLLLRRHDIRLDYGLAGGATMDLGCYTIRLLRYLLDAEPQVVRAHAICHRPQIDRKMVVEFRFPSASGDIGGAMSCAFWSRRLIRITAKIVGDAGELHVINPLLPQLFHLVRIKSGAGSRYERCPGASTYHYQLAAFVQAIRHQQPPLTDGHDGVANMRVIDAIYQAAGLQPR
ncbi:MAG: Gfo/Idh/MocA family oxidoreductase [Caldilineaceae bacterium]